MTPYREILRLADMNLTQMEIAASCNISKKTVNRALKRAREIGISWPLDDKETDDVLEERLYPPVEKPVSSKKRMPDFERIQRELKRNGVNKKLLWTEYLEECRLSGDEPLMYSQFCYHIQQDEQRRGATMHLKRNPGEQIEVDWAGDPAQLVDPDTGEITKAWLFVGVLTYSQYPYVEAFINEKQKAWIAAHIHMFEYFGGVARILVPDNCKTAVIHNNDWYNQEVNTVYHEMAEHYNTAIVPARVRTPKDKPSAEGSVGVISTWITAALRDEQFFSLAELNAAIREKLETLVHKPFQKREGTRYEVYRNEEFPLLTKLPEHRYELAEWKVATVQFNYHISIDTMQYSVPYEYIKRKVNVRLTDTVVEIFYNNRRITSHRRLYGRKGQYSTIVEHMPPDHQKYLEWNGDRFRKWAERIGPNTSKVINGILSSNVVEQQAYRSCMGLLKLADKYSVDRLEAACERALSFTESPSYKSIRNILSARKEVNTEKKIEEKPASPQNIHALTRGADYYRR